MHVMTEFFGAWEQRVVFLDELAASEHEPEAFLLASCYIEALGHGLYPDCEGSQRAFCKALIEHGGSAVFGGHHPRALKDWLTHAQEAWARGVAVKVGAVLDGLIGTLFTEGELRRALEPYVTTAEMRHLTPSLWHATYAAVVYTDTRSEAVHNFPATAVEFSASTFGGQAVPAINYRLLAPALKAILMHCEKVSFESRLYFGHDLRKLFSATSSKV